LQLFYSIDIDKQKIIFQDEELRHLTVLRKNIGDTIYSTDGKGNLYESQLIAISKKEAIGNIISIEKKEQPNQIHVHLLIAPTKQMERIEWLFEKLVELGLQEITLIETQHGERHKINIERLEKIALSAMKQSLRFHLPIVNSLQKLKTCLDNKSQQTIKLIAHCEEDFSKTNLNNIVIENDVKYEIYIGPEGDFSTEEIKYAQEKGALPISLGSYRLRTETAGLMSSINLLSRL
jgi:16S rRNA (uracil1498-N3)-methyltransferase